MKICIKKDLSIAYEGECVKIVELKEEGDKLISGDVKYLRGDKHD